MRIASRHMPKFRPRPAGPWAWSFLAIAGAGLVHLVLSAPTAAALCLLLLWGGAICAHRSDRRARVDLRRLAEARGAESICEFARSFDLRAVDPWIVRAVYEQLQQQLQHVHPAFPIRASDHLKQDLRLDDDELDLNLATQVEQRTGRRLDACEGNPLFGRVSTVSELVLFFQAQPRHA